VHHVPVVANLAGWNCPGRVRSGRINRVRGRTSHSPRGDRDRTSTKPCQAKTIAGADRLGQHHRRLPVQPVHRRPRRPRPPWPTRRLRRPDPLNRRRSHASRGHENLRHPQHEPSCAHLIPDRGHGLPDTASRKIPVNQQPPPQSESAASLSCGYCDAVFTVVYDYGCHCLLHALPWMPDIRDRADPDDPLGCPRDPSAHGHHGCTPHTIRR